MKKNQIKELFIKPEKELFKMLGETREELAKFQIELKTSKLKNVMAIGEKKKTIARILTAISGKGAR